MSDKLERYDMMYENGDYVGMSRITDGDYVKYEDIKEMINQPKHETVDNSKEKLKKLKTYHFGGNNNPMALVRPTPYLKYRDVVRLIESLSEPKHETVEQWENRTGKTYPDDGPVWSHYRYIMLKNKEEWKIEKWGDCKGWEWDSDNPAIVANHHGKPEDV